MPRTEQPGVPAAIALRDVDGGPETLRAVDERVDAPALRDIIAVLRSWIVGRFPASNAIDGGSAIEVRMRTSMTIRSGSGATRGYECPYLGEGPMHSAPCEGAGQS